jgi:iron complex outermembrane receptor protein
MSRFWRAACALSAAAAILPQVAAAQNTTLPTITVESVRAPAARPQSATGESGSAAPSVAAPREAAASANQSLTVPTTEQARRAIDYTPGGVEVVPDTAFKDGPARTVKDVLGWVPGVLTQPRWGPDGRVSIRGSGLSRNYGNRGINFYMDGIPINTADGLFDLFEIDPTAYRYAEVFKGANALRFGANSLGGAVNFVTPSGRDAPGFDSRFDAGSFGFIRGQASTAGARGPADWFMTGSAQREEGYRDHSNGHMERGSANVGYRFSPDAETRFYVNANSWRARLPGEVTKAWALNTPKLANPEFVRLDQQRNIDSLRLANKTALRFGPTTVEFGIFGVDRHVMHPIYQWLDYTVRDYGGFVRTTDDRMIGGFRNRLVAGVNVHNGTIDNNQYINLPGAVKGALAASNIDKSENVSAYGENAFFFLPNVAVVAGGLFLHAVRDRTDRFLTNGDQSGRRTYDIFSPKVGLLWDVDPTWQVFGNVSQSAEVPTFDANTFTMAASSNLNAQTATTYEIGTRGRRPDITWDISLYRAGIRNELQCLTTAPWAPCTIVNADRTVHQGVEAGLGIAFLKSIFAQEDRVWFNLAYTYSDFFFDNDPVYGNNRLPGAPPQYVRAELLYKHPNGFFAGPNVEWVPQGYYADNANTVTVDPYALLNVRIGYDRGTGWSGYLEGRNLFDTRYISSVAIAGIATPASEIFNPGTGRGIYGGLRYRM